MKKTLITLMTSLALGAAVNAAPITWNNTATNFNAGTSWVGGVAPTLGDIAIFPQEPGGTAVNPILTGNIHVGGIQMNAKSATNAHRWSGIGGAGQTLTLGSDGLQMIAFGALTINPNVSLNNSQAWTISSNENVVLTGNVNGGADVLWNIGRVGDRDRGYYGQGSFQGFTGQLVIGGGGVNNTTAALVLDNFSGNNNDRWSNTLGVTVTNGNSFGLRGVNAGSTTTDETIGQLTVNGSGGLYVNRLQTTNTVTLRAASVDLGDRGVMLVRNQNAGALGVTEQVFINSGSPTPVNGVLDGRFIGRAGSGNSTDTLNANFLTYGADGFAVATYHAGFNSGSSTEVADITSGTTVAVAEEAEAVRLSGASASLTLNANLTINNGSLLIARTATTSAITGTGTLILNGSAGNYIYSTGGAHTISTAINAATGLIKSGSENLTLSGVLTAPSIKVNDGTLTSTNAGNSIDLVYTVGNGATSIFTPSNASRTIRGLRGEALGTIGGGGGGGGTLTIQTQSGDDFVFLGNAAISNATLIKTGAGSQTLNNWGNAVARAIDVNEGALIINGLSSNTGNVTVASGATLGGNGTVSGAAFITGKLSPGNSIGSFTIDNNATWLGAAAASTATDWVFELGASNTSDRLNITGQFLKDISLGEDFRFDFAGSTALGTFTLIDWDSTASLGGGALGTSFAISDFSGINLGGSNTIDSFSFNGTSLQVTVVPEPSTAVMLLGGLGAMILLRRRYSFSMALRR